MKGNFRGHYMNRLRDYMAWCARVLGTYKSGNRRWWSSKLEVSDITFLPPSDILPRLIDQS